MQSPVFPLKRLQKPCAATRLCTSCVRCSAFCRFCSGFLSARGGFLFPPRFSAFLPTSLLPPYSDIIGRGYCGLCEEDKEKEVNSKNMSPYRFGKAVFLCSFLFADRKHFLHFFGQEFIFVPDGVVLAAKFRVMQVDTGNKAVFNVLPNNLLRQK